MNKWLKDKISNFKNCKRKKINCHDSHNSSIIWQCALSLQMFTQYLFVPICEKNNEFWFDLNEGEKTEMESRIKSRMRERKLKNKREKQATKS